MLSITTPTKTVILTASVALLIAGTTAFAQEDGLTPQERKEQQKILLEERKATMEARKADMEAKKEARADALEERKEDWEARKEEHAVNIEARKADMAAKKEEFQQKREVRKAALTERAQQRLINLSANITKRMNAAINRLRDITDRMISRTEAIEASGIDTGATKDTLQAVHDGLNTAASMLQEVEQAAAAAVTSEDPREAFKGVKAGFGDVRDIIAQSHQLLRSGVSELKTAAQATRTVSEDTTEGDTIE